MDDISAFYLELCVDSGSNARVDWKLKMLLLFLLLLVGGILICQLLVLNTGATQLFFSVNMTPKRETGLLLGTSPKLANGERNPFFANRIEAASALYRAGKLRRIIVSGDNSHRNYDEPTAMKAALIARGVPSKAITCDFAGFRTLDSVVRAKKAFGVSEVTIISQEFHVKRALLIADHFGLNAIGFCARDVPKSYSLRTRIREWGARVRVVLDLYVLKTQPHFQATDANHETHKKHSRADKDHR